MIKRYKKNVWLYGFVLLFFLNSFLLLLILLIKMCKFLFRLNYSDFMVVCGINFLVGGSICFKRYFDF